MKFGIAAAIATVCIATDVAAFKGGNSNGTGLEKIKHFVYFMQENGAFDHYFGTMAGVPGFNDPNVGVQANGNNLYYQPDHSSPDIKNGSPAPSAGNSPMSMGYETREQVPFHFAFAEEFTIADMYFNLSLHQLAPIAWFGLAAPFQDNTETPKLKYPQNMTTAGVSWQVFQDNDNFDDDPLAWFQYWDELPNGTVGASKQLACCWRMAGKTSGRVGYAPPLWNQTALIINYDESGGFYDHVVPPQAPKSEWQRAKLESGVLKSPALGPRVPLICISPYCRGGNVYT
ncbi:hypothetical protein Unana1_08041 [Umbelopsis nana]